MYEIIKKTLPIIIIIIVIGVAVSQFVRSGSLSTQLLDRAREVEELTRKSQLSAEELQRLRRSNAESSEIIRENEQRIERLRSTIDEQQRLIARSIDTIDEQQRGIREIEQSAEEFYLRTERESDEIDRLFGEIRTRFDEVSESSQGIRDE